MTKTARYDFIDAMRGLAILAVIFHHVAPCVEGLSEGVTRFAGVGSFGVQLFFIVSAATLSLSMDSRHGRETHPYACFLIRRFFRIAPLFYVGAVFYTGMRYLRGEGGVDAMSFLLTLSFAHVWVPHAVNLVVPGGWSIGVEMNFYLLAPFLHRRVRSFKTAVACACVAFVPAAILSTIVRVILPHWNGEMGRNMGGFAWYWPPMQFPVFFLGFALYALLKSDWARGPRDPITDRRLSRLLLGAAGYLIVSTALSDLRVYLGLANLGVAFVLMGWALALHPTPLLVNRLTRSLGVVSFSAYITHFAMIDVMSALWKTPAFASVAALPSLAKLGVFMGLVLAGTAAASFITYRLIELPGQHLGSRLIDAIEGRTARRPNRASQTHLPSSEMARLFSNREEAPLV